MPGVPPDAMEKLKGAFKGMFKKKKTKNAATPTTAGTTETATPTTTAPAAAAASIPNTTTSEPAGTGKVVEGAWPGPSAAGTESDAVGIPSIFGTGTPVVEPVPASEAAPIAVPAPGPTQFALAKLPAAEGGVVEPTPVTTVGDTKSAAVTEADPHHDPVAVAYAHAFEKFPTSVPATATSTDAPIAAATSTIAPTT